MKGSLSEELIQTLELVASGYASFDLRDAASAVQQRCEQLWQMGYVEKHSDHDREHILWYRLTQEGLDLMEQYQDGRWHDED